MFKLFVLSTYILCFKTKSLIKFPRSCPDWEPVLATLLVSASGQAISLACACRSRHFLQQRCVSRVCRCMCLNQYICCLKYVHSHFSALNFQVLIASSSLSVFVRCSRLACSTCSASFSHCISGLVRSTVQVIALCAPHLDVMLVIWRQLCVYAKLCCLIGTRHVILVLGTP